MASERINEDHTEPTASVSSSRVAGVGSGKPMPMLTLKGSRPDVKADGRWRERPDINVPDVLLALERRKGHGPVRTEVLSTDGRGLDRQAKFDNVGQRRRRLAAQNVRTVGRTVRRMSVRVAMTRGMRITM